MSLTAHRILQYIALILIFTAMAGGYWYWKSQAAVRINQGLEDSLEQGLVGYWKLDDASGTTATDSSGNGNNGTLTNGPTWGAGQVNGGVVFDGVDDRINSVSNSPQIASLTKATVSFWVNPTQIGGIFNTLSDDFGGNGPFSNGFEITKDSWHGTQTIRLAVDGSTGDMMAHSTAVLPLSTWTHVVVVWDGSLTSTGTKFYYNGGIAGTTAQENGSGVYVPSDGRFKMGVFTGGNSPLGGSLDEVRVYNRTLSDEEVFRLYQTAVPQGIDTGLVGYWPFDGDDISGSIAYDRSGKGNNAALANNPMKVMGKSGQALGLDGTQYADIPHQSYLNSYPLTVSTWFKTSSASGIPGLVNKYVGGSANGYQIFMYNGQLCAWYFSGSGSYVYDNSSNCTFYLSGYNDNNWHQATFVVDASGGKLYVDGVLGGSRAWSGSPGATTTTQQVTLGDYDDNFPGSLDEVRIYNRALTTAEVQDLYQKTQSDTVGSSNKRDSLALGLAGYWKLDDASGTTAIDSSTNGNNGTLTNGPTWGTGQINGATTFDGSNDYINIPSVAAAQFGNTTFTFSGWIKTLGTDRYIAAQDRCNGGWGVSIDSFYKVTVSLLGAGACGPLAALRTSKTAITPNEWHHIAAVIKTDTSNGANNNISIYIDGALNQDILTTGSAYGASGANGLEISGRYLSDLIFNGSIDEVRLYNRGLSTDEVSRLYRTTAPTGVDTGLKGYWSFDGQSVSGTTASDWSGAGNNGTITSGITKVLGKTGQALDFSAGNGVQIDSLTQTGQTYTFSTWAKLTDTSTTYIFDTNNGRLVLDAGYSAPTARAISYYDGTWKSIGAENSIPLNEWVHLAWVLNSSSGTATGYVNGVSVGTNTYVGKNIGTSTRIGSYFAGGAGVTQGVLDEFRIYNRALSIEEIREEYDYGKADKVNTAASDPLTDGLVGYWKLDDASGTTATDSSGNGNNGTLTNGPTWGTGQVNGGVVFDGTDDYVTANRTMNSSVLTYAAWVKWTSGTDGTVIGTTFGGTQFRIINSSGSGTLNLLAAGVANAGSSTNKITGGIWNHVVVTNDAAGNYKFYINGADAGGSGTYASGYNASPGIAIGARYYDSGTENFTGSIDETRIYNRPLSDEEVSRLYRTTAPTGVDTGLVGYWPFDGDDFSGTTTYDRSGKGNNGTLTNGPTKTIGKMGQALSFDGSDDYIITAHDSALNAYPITVSTWIKTGVNDGTRRYILNKYEFPNGYAINLLSGKIRAWYLTSSSGTDYVYDGGDGMSSKTVVSDNQWHHVSFVVDSSGGKLYIDGNLEDSMAWTGTPQATNTTQGVRWSAVQTGGAKIVASLDETRIYNRALTTAEIRNLYSKGR